MRHVILYREALFRDELRHASGLFPCIYQRTRIRSGDVVIPRYTMLPYPTELEVDICYLGGTLLNSAAQHRAIADLGTWAPELVAAGLTPHTWEVGSQPISGNGPWVVKGQTNSRKAQWKTHMYAKDRDALNRVIHELSTDSLIGAQQLYARQYVPLQSYGELHGGLPMSLEYRFFCLDGKLLHGEFYFENLIEDFRDATKIPDWRPPQATALESDAYLTLDRVLAKVGHIARFLVVDIAKTKAGDWICIELNDGCMAGTAEPEHLYPKLRAVLADTTETP